MENSPKEVEAAFRQIAGVQAARLVTDESGKPVEIHIVANSDKSPKQLVRDIQTVSLASFGIDLDHRIISVVQFPDSEAPAVRESARPSIEEIATGIMGKTATVRVTLKSGDESVQGEASGPNSREAMVKTAAAATVNALTEICGPRIWLEVDHVTVQRSGGHEVAVATINVADAERATSLSGSAVISGLQTEAVVRAVLAAVNRKLWREFS